MTKYYYGMRLRGYSIGAQPSGVVRRIDSKQYHDIIVYARELTEKELLDYSLDFIKTEEIK